jgi:hypothetical protein
MRALSLSLAWAIALTLLLPAGWAGGCGDCFGMGVQGCCPPVCSLCLCCVQSPAVLAVAPGMDRDPGVAPLSVASPEGNPLSAHPCDVFHVPKTFLI